MRNYFIFDNNDSRDYGVYINGGGVFNAPTRAYNPITVPGRNGDLLLDEKRYENIEVIYPAFIVRDFNDNLSDLRDMLLSVNGYARLEDSYNSDEFRLGYFSGGIEVEPTARLDAGNFELLFTCKPQRFLKSGETVTSITSSSGTISNPTEFNSKPLIRVYGYGTLTINSDVITIASGYNYIDIDCDIQDCYYGTTNANSKVTFQSNDFPVLVPGSNGISRAGNITKIEITPRWWKL